MKRTAALWFLLASAACAARVELVKLDLERPIQPFALSLTEDTDTTIRATLRAAGADFDPSAWTGLLWIGTAAGGITLTNCVSGYGSMDWTLSQANMPTNGRYEVLVFGVTGTVSEAWGRGAASVRLNPARDAPPAEWQAGNQAWITATNALGIAQALGPRIEQVETRTNDWNTAFAWGNHTLAGYLPSAAWLSWIGTNTYVKSERDLAALAALGTHTDNGDIHLSPAQSSKIDAAITSEQDLDALAALAAHRVTRLHDASLPDTWAVVEGGTNVVVYGLEVSGTNFTVVLSPDFRASNGATPSWFNETNSTGWPFGDDSGFSCVPEIYAPYGHQGTEPVITYWDGADESGYWHLYSQQWDGTYPFTLITDSVGPSGYAEGTATVYQHIAYTTNVLYRYPLRDDYATTGDLAASASAIVQTYILTTNAWMTVSNSTLSVTIITNGVTDTIWSSAESAGGLDPSFSNAVWSALSGLSAALDGKADTAWGKYTPYGETNPDPEYMTWLNSPATVFSSGAQWSTDGTFAVLTTAGTTAFAAGDSGQFRIGPNSTNWFGYVSGGSVTIGAVAESLSVTAGGTTNGTATIVYPYSSGDFPTLWFAPSLSVDFTELSGVVWADNTNGTATVTAPATSPGGFFSATTTAVFDNYFRSTMPARLDGGVFGATNAAPVVYDSVIEVSAGGKTYRIPAQEVAP